MSMVRPDRAPDTIRVADYPQLAVLCWSTPNLAEITDEHAFGLYEREWRHVDQTALTASETSLIDRLTVEVGRGTFMG
jgi:hypothetical protein